MLGACRGLDAGIFYPDDDDEAEVDSAEESGTVERMLLVAWEVEVPSGNLMRRALVLPTGETIGQLESEPREPRDRD